MARGFHIHVGKEVEGIRGERAVAIERRDFGRELRGHWYGKQIGGREGRGADYSKQF